MSYPIPVMKVASKAKMMQYQHLTMWHALDAMRFGSGPQLDETITRQAATAIAHKFVDDVIRGAYIERVQAHDGLEVRFSCVALRRDQLLHLLYEAYLEGQSDGMRRTPEVRA